VIGDHETVKRARRGDDGGGETTNHRVGGGLKPRFRAAVVGLKMLHKAEHCERSCACGTHVAGRAAADGRLEG
jgi:hypothetical protein